MKIVSTIKEMQEISISEARKGRTVAVVPTMGYLHEGHMSLVDIAKKEADFIIVTIFVNPSQFAPNEDLDKYPRDFERDCKLCKERGVDIVFAPSVTEMYPEDFSTWVCEEKLSRGLCGKSRPSHFRGVTTIVTKLFNATLPHIAVFGEKDYQQAMVIKRMARDLNFPIKILTGPIVRENDGLAMSSRNKYLSPEDRQKALSISKSLAEGEHAFYAGQSIEQIIERIKLRISQSGGQVDYVEVLDADTLDSVCEKSKNILLAIAAFFGGTRLIDNRLISVSRKTTQSA